MAVASPGLGICGIADGPGHLRPEFPALSGKRVRGLSPAESSVQSGAQRDDRAGTWLLAGASLLLLALAVGMGYVSWRAQLVFVTRVKHQSFASAVQALGLDCGAAIFGLLALAHARLGRAAVAERALNVACAGGSLLMNVAAPAHASARDVLIYAMPAALYVAASDRLVATARHIAIAGTGREHERSAWSALAKAALYLMRFVLAAPSTARGIRRIVLDAAPVPEPKPRPDAYGIALAPRVPRRGSKTAELLRLAEERYGALVTIPLDRCSNIATRLAPEIGLHPGSARTALLNACRAAHATSAS